jgi:hypothetical protein
MGAAVNSFPLSGGLLGKLVLRPVAGRGYATYLEKLTGHISGLKGAKNWTIALTIATPGTYKPTTPLTAKTHLNRMPSGVDVIVKSLGALSGHSRLRARMHHRDR